jgi:hypothetical protein
VRKFYHPIRLAVKRLSDGTCLAPRGTPRIRFVVGFTLAAGYLAAAPAQAQRPAPGAGSWALGASIAVNAPIDESFENSLGVSGHVEAAVSPRVTVRGQAGIGWWNLDPLQGLVGSVHPLAVVGNVVFNWKRGAARPYVTAGAGMYRDAIKRVVSSRSTVRVGETHAGLNVGGGLEFSQTRRSAFTAELLYHRVPDFGEPLSFANGSFWSASVGVKTYVGR